MCIWVLIDSRNSSSYVFFWTFRHVLMELLFDSGHMGLYWWLRLLIHTYLFILREKSCLFPHMKISWHILSFRTLWLKYQILGFIILLLELKVIWQSTISLSCLVACRLFRSAQALFWSLTREPDTTSSPGSKLQVSSMLASNYALYLSKLEKAWTFF